MIDKKILTIAGAFLGISIGIFILLSSLIANFLSNKNKLIVYTILFIIAFAMIAVLGFKGLISEPLILCVVFQCCFLILGILHVNAVYHHFEWSEEKSFLPEFGFTIFIWMICVIPYLLIYKAINDDGFHYIMIGTTLFFIVPLFFNQTFESAIQIPEKIYKRWIFPAGKKMEDPSDSEMGNLLIISLLIQRKGVYEELTQFKIKAPENMPFGKLFYFFIEDYNSAHPDMPIEYSDKLAKPYEWMFYFKPIWYLGNLKRYIDPELTSKQNKLRENSVIVCERCEG
jgi:hypothetical protein